MVSLLASDDATHISSLLGTESHQEPAVYLRLTQLHANRFRPRGGFRYEPQRQGLAVCIGRAQQAHAGAGPIETSVMQ
ncbi:hypothetical protein D3C72_865720 [compost metagenome]